ncbi:MAG: tRNA pseudouridine(38-40) synthase TruA [Bacteroidales bacterium]|nr:tRNA pseudouridine(38-40) synthase TruA [Candidatus Cryptobacteroides aphodequi]
MRYKITLSYNGAAFCGWQRQSSDPSVQQTLEESLGTLLRTPVEVTGAGRTDTGVNATGYVAHFDSEAVVDPGALVCKLNAILPSSICVHNIAEAAPDFHARFDASRREYTYFLHRGKDPFLSGNSYLCAYPVLDFEAMNKAAALLLGTHDFSCFEKTGADNKTSICTIFEAHWDQYTPAVCCGAEGQYWKFTVAADRFLRNMVRAIVGTLIEVGRGKRTPESILELLDSRERSKAGESVPGFALYLSKIEY